LQWILRGFFIRVSLRHTYELSSRKVADDIISSILNSLSRPCFTRILRTLHCFLFFGWACSLPFDRDRLGCRVDFFLLVSGHLFSSLFSSVSSLTLLFPLSDSKLLFWPPGNYRHLVGDRAPTRRPFSGSIFRFLHDSILERFFSPPLLRPSPLFLSWRHSPRRPSFFRDGVLPSSAF